MLLMARYLGQEEYGDFQFVAGVINLLAQPTMVMTLIVTRINCNFTGAAFKNNVKWFFKRYNWAALSIFLTSALLFTLLDRHFVTVGNVGTRGTFMVAGVTVSLSMVINYYLGFLQALEDFRGIGIIFLVIGIFTLLTGVVVVVTDAGILWAYASESVSRIIALAVLLWLIWNRLPANSQPASVKQFSISRYTFYLFFSMMAFFCAFNMDIFAVKGLFNRMLAGYYLRLDFVGKLMFLLGSTFAIIIFPRSSKEFENGGNPIGILMKGSVIYWGFSALVAICIVSFSDTMFSLIFGKSFDVDKTLLIMLISARICQSYIYILINYLAAIISRLMVYGMLAFVSCQFFLLYLFHETLIVVSACMLVSSLICTLVLLFVILYRFSDLHLFKFARRKWHEL